PPRLTLSPYTTLFRSQLHGHEPAEGTRWVRERVRIVIKGFVAGDPTLERADDFGVDAILIDSHAPGSGEVFDWSLAEGAPIGRRDRKSTRLNSSHQII